MQGQITINVNNISALLISTNANISDIIGLRNTTNSLITLTGLKTNTDNTTILQNIRWKYFIIK